MIWVFVFILCAIMNVVLAVLFAHEVWWRPAMHVIAAIGFVHVACLRYRLLFPTKAGLGD